MKMKERQKSEESDWYASAARSPSPGAMVETEPAELAQGESEEDVAGKRRKLSWAAIAILFSATIAVAAGNVFDSIYWATLALFYTIEAKPRGRVPKLLRYLAAAAVMILTVVQLVRLLAKYWH